MPYARFNPELKGDKYDPEPEMTPDEAKAFLEVAHLAEEKAPETGEIDLPEVSKKTIEPQQLALDSIYKKNDQ